MIASFVTRLVDLCIRHAWGVIGFALILGVGRAFYVDRHFAINTHVNKLLSSDLPWKKRAAQYAADFPERGIVVVLEAPTPELADDAASRLSEALEARKDLFTVVDQPGGGSFFARNGLLFLSQAAGDNPAPSRSPRCYSPNCRASRITRAACRYAQIQCSL